MKRFFMSVTSQMIICRLLFVVAFLLVATIRISSAQVPGSVHEKYSKRVVDGLASGKPQDLIVVFNDKSVQKSAENLQSLTGLSSQHSRIIEHKALKRAETKQKVLSSLAAHESTELRTYSHLPVGFLRIHSQEALDKLLADANVIGVYENTIERKSLAESLPLIGQPQVAAQGNLGAGTSVAVLDTGLDYTQSAFGSCTSPGIPASCKVVYTQDFAPDDGKLDNDGHGTNVSGIVAGVAPGAKIIGLDVFSGSPATGDLGAATSDILAAINWVISNKSNYNIVAINMSLGSGKYTAPVSNGAYNAAVDQARAAGILTVAAAGNDGYSNALSQPAATTGVISVGAVYDSALGTLNWGNPLRCSDTNSAADKVTCFSNSTSFLTMLAPGSQILAAGITEGGTSQAAPHVAGAVAVLRAAYPAETLDQTVIRLTTGVIVTDSRNDIAKPRLDLQMALGLTTTTCSYTLSENSKSFSSIASSGSITITTAASCSWSAASNTSSSGWITVTAGKSGSGTGTVQYSVAANDNSTSRTGTITVAGQVYTVNQSGSTAAVSNILLNPGFENGPVSWTENSVSGLPIITAYLSPTASNNWYAWLCGYNDCVDTLYQDVTIPADAQSAYVQFSYAIATDEKPGPTPFDTMTVRVYSPPNATKYTYWTLSNLDAAATPVLSPKYDVSAFKGQSIRLQFSATTDASFNTNFFIDDVTLIVSGTTPDTQAPTVPTGLTAVAASTSIINLSWNAATDNTAVTSYKLYRGGALFATLDNVTSYSNTGLSTGTTYSYTVSACDAAGNCSAQSAASSATTGTTSSDAQPPTVPDGLLATVSDVSTIHLAWNASSDNVGVSSYNVYRNGTLLTAAATTAYSDIGLSPSTTYTYTVSACDAASNCSAQSPAVQATTDPLANLTPVVMSGSSSFQVNGTTVDISIDKITNTSASGHSGSLKLELWALESPYFGGSITGYVTASIRTYLINGATDTLAANASFSNIALSNLPYTAPPPVTSSLYAYALFLLEYDSTCTTVDNFCIIDYMNFHETQPPSIPAAVSATAISSSQISLAWTASTDNVGVTTYKVYRNGTLFTLLGNVTSYTNGGLTPSTRYSYTVSACDAAGNCSAQSTAALATTMAPADTQAPTTPTGLTVTAATSTRINILWSAATDNVAVTAYKVYSGGGLVDTVGAVTSTFRTVVPATTYSYSVAACDAAGNCSAQSAPQSATTPAATDTQAPTVPTGVTATAVSTSQINLSWKTSTDNIGVTAYTIFSSDGQTLPVGNVTNYSHTGLRPATAYSYTIAACDAAGNCSVPSTSASATTSVTPVTGKPGDCDNSGTVTIAEVQSAINMFLGLKTVATCVDLDGVGGVSIAEVQKTINSFLGL
jgi:chitodextrinase/subtilisin family serine protease